MKNEKMKRQLTSKTETGKGDEAGMNVRKLVLIFSFFIFHFSLSFAATVTTVDDKALTGTIAAFDGGKLEVITTAGHVSVPAEDIVSVAMQQPGRPADTDCLVRLRNGDVLYGAIAGGAGEELEVQSPSLGTVTVAVGELDAIVFERGQNNGVEQAEAPEKDQLVLRNGDSLPGVLVQFAKEALTFDCSLGKVDIPFNRIRSVKLAAVGEAYKEPDALLMMITCIDGSIVTGRDAKLAGDELSITSTLGTALKIKLSRVATMEFKNGRLVYLSDLDPCEVKEVPMFDERPWQYRRDRSVSGNPIRVGGKVYRKGLGVHSRCELTYDLAGRFKRFASLIGIDDEVGGGNVEIRILLDGAQIFPKPPDKLTVSKKTAPVNIDINVTDAKKLTLVVDFGEELHVNDHADWADARLTR